jgi:hypothetical protein
MKGFPGHFARIAQKDQGIFGYYNFSFLKLPGGQGKNGRV